MRVAILGAWHVHADDYVKVALKSGEVVGVYDSNTERRTKFAQKYSIPEFATVEELLASDAQGVICCSATNEHKDLIISSANAGKHIFTEKVLALTEEDCQEIRNAVEKNGVNFVISFPWKSRGAIRSVKKAVDEGVIGKPNYMRFRNCHDGSLSHWLPEHFYSREQCGGGAMIDLGAHGMYLTHWIMGEPSGYKSSFEHFCRDEKDALFNKDCIEDKLFSVQTEIIRNAAETESCVIVGRCAESILKGHKNMFSVFIHADAEFRAKRVAEFENITFDKAFDLVKKRDKQRASYHNYFSDSKWGDARSYDICINSSIGTENVAKLIQHYAEML